MPSARGAEAEGVYQIQWERGNAEVPPLIAVNNLSTLAVGQRASSWKPGSRGTRQGCCSTRRSSARTWGGTAPF